MPLVLVGGATIQCMHQGVPYGKSSIPSGDARLAVSGNGALTAGMEAGVSFAPGKPGVLTPCTFPDPKSGAPTPCTATQAALSGASTILAVGGAGVLLDIATGLASNTADPAATWKVADAGQQVLSVNG
jgi:hypothetical protein